MSNEVSDMDEELIKILMDTATAGTARLVETCETIIKTKDAIISDLQDTLLQMQRIHKQDVKCIQEKSRQVEILEGKVQEAENRYQLRKEMMDRLWEENKDLGMALCHPKQIIGTEESTDNFTGSFNTAEITADSENTQGAIIDASSNSVEDPENVDVSSEKSQVDVPASTLNFTSSHEIDLEVVPPLIDDTASCSGSFTSDPIVAWSLASASDEPSTSANSNSWNRGRSDKGHITSFYCCGPDESVDDDDTGSQIFRCTCGREFESQAERDEHVWRKKRRSGGRSTSLRNTFFEEDQVPLENEDCTTAHPEHGSGLETTKKGEMVYLCLCKKWFKSRKARQEHIYRQSRTRVCKFCTFGPTIYRTWKRHMKQCHNLGGSGDTFCTKCLHSFQDFVVYRGHLHKCTARLSTSYETKSK